jgi:hypothetical protein
MDKLNLNEQQDDQDNLFENWYKLRELHPAWPLCMHDYI